MSDFGAELNIVAHGSILRHLDVPGREYPFTAEAGDMFRLPNDVVLHVEEKTEFADQAALESWIADRS